MSLARPIKHEIAFVGTCRSCLPISAFGSIADIGTRPRHVRFTPKSGHSVAHLGCPLCAKSRHTATGLAAEYPMKPVAMKCYDVTGNALQLAKTALWSL